MRSFWSYIVFFVFLLSALSFTTKRLDYRKARNLNVCKALKGDILVYYIFVDTKTTTPWTQFDIQSTNDSINAAIRWLMYQGRKNNIELKIKSDYYIGKEFSTVKKDLPEKSVESTISSPNLKMGIENLNKWADIISKKVGESFNITEKDGIPEIKNPRNKERLVAFLRDEYKVESVALLFMVNNYYKTDISIPMNTFSVDDVEYAIVSYKYPTVIAHSILNLFGAADMFSSPFRKNDKNIKFAEQEFPNEIMLDPYAKKLNKVELSPYTQYLIGWSDTLDVKYQELLYDNRFKF